VKLRIVVLMVCGIAGAGASFAFAAGDSHGRNAFCRPTFFVGTVSAPQSFNVTVTRTSWWRSGLKRGQNVNVSVGSSGQTLRFIGQGCVASDGSVTVNQGVLQVVRQHGNDGPPPSTTTTSNPPATTTTGDTPPTTTTGDDPPTTTTTGDNPPTTTTTTTTTPHGD
jgi:hypothetical protein